MKYKVGQKVQDKKDLIRGRIIDYFEQDDTKYWVVHNNGVAIFLESELEIPLEARLFDFCKRLISDPIAAVVIFALGLIVGVLL